MDGTIALPLARVGRSTRPDRVKDRVVRWRRVDLERLIETRFGVLYHERAIGKLLKQSGFSHIGARPRHLGQNAETMAAGEGVK